jgi:hypothetical protein
VLVHNANVFVSKFQEIQKYVDIVTKQVYNTKRTSDFIRKTLNFSPKDQKDVLIISLFINLYLGGMYNGSFSNWNAGN